MNPVLAKVYNLDKTASEEDGQVTLNDITAADLLAAHQSGEIDINDYLPAEDNSEKTAADEEEGVDLSQYSDEQLLEALTELEDSTEDNSEKIASDEAAYWDAAGRTMARGYFDEMSKSASEPDQFDLNTLSPEEVVELGYVLVNEMGGEKTAATDADEIDLNAMTPEEIIELAYHLENEMGEEKTAGVDLNAMSVDEFVGFAADVEAHMEKEAKVNVSGLAAELGRKVHGAGHRVLRGGKISKLESQSARSAADDKKLEALKAKGEISEEMARRLGYGTAAAGAGATGLAAFLAAKKSKK